MRSTATALIAIAAVLVAGVSIAVSASGDDPAPAGVGSAPVERVPAQLSDLIAAFDRSQADRDRIPGGDPLEALEQVGPAAPGENPRLARRLATAGGDEVFVWPSSRDVCVQWGMSIVCSPVSRLRDRGVIVGWSYTRDSAQQFEVVVLVRNGIPEVDIVREDGSRQSIPVPDNAVYVRAGSQPSAIVWTNPDGSRGSEEVPVLPR
jgi:hypothetical protein